MTDSRSVGPPGPRFRRPGRRIRPAHRRQLGADGVERAAEVAELLLRQIERDVELAASQPRQAALDDVDRPEHPLREQHREDATR